MRVKENRLEPTCTVCYRLSTPLEHYFITLISLLLIEQNQPQNILNPAKILDQEKERKERKMRIILVMTLVGSIGNFDQAFFFHSYLLLGSIFFHFCSILAELRRGKTREKLSTPTLDFALFDRNPQN